ncbi:hypothetical protein BPAE_0192g00040 [Botrytis paeoniae]|uniref:Uncharacterized protein n=1 Tax=Botrytis paeoniae TaxID=278948 RepID=A0A4Z1FBX8_9HELO|nr:hypothetical protein BPAE_0192g00040 [Botrytis paeoniae]
MVESDFKMIVELRSLGAFAFLLLLYGLLEGEERRGEERRGEERGGEERRGKEKKGEERRGKKRVRTREREM